MTMTHPHARIPRLWALRSALIVAALPLAAFTAMAGTWIPLQNAAPDNVQLMLLLPDGTVMAANSGGAGTAGKAWYKLTPDKNGSYVKGTWTTLAPMADTRLFYSSVVLRDGRVFVAGGEYGTGGAKAEIYDPQNNVWTPVPVPANLLDPTQPSPALASGNQAFLDSDAMLLPDGRVMVAPVAPKNAFEVLIYDPQNNNWVTGPSAGLGNQNESSWVKLPDDSILTIDAGSTNVERFLPENYLPGHINPVPSNTWIADSPLPLPLYGSPGNEIGPGLLLPGGAAFFFGANGNTAIYTPSGDNSQGTWTPGPLLPNVIQYPIEDGGAQRQEAPITVSGAAPDAPAAMLVNGRILCALSGPLYNDPRVQNPPTDYWKTQKNPQYPKPTTFFIYDPVAKTFTPISDPYGNVTENVAPYQLAMLDLPDGTVLFADQAPQLFVYALDPVHNPEERIDPASRPTIATVTPNPDGSWHLTGTQLNGLSQGAAYGDDAQMDSNYPLVRLLADSGEVTYARTFNWSSTGVQTKDRMISTDFTLPAVVGGTGGIHLQVVANGIASDPVPLPLVLPAETLTFSGNASMGDGPYEIRGGITTFQDDGSAGGMLLREDGGTIQLLDTATAGTATVGVDGGMGNGGLPGHLLFHGSSTAGAANIVNHAGVLGPNFKNASPNPMDGWGGETRFYDNATAGTARISNDGESHTGASNGASGGYTAFAGNASADHAILIVRGATISNGRGGRVDFTGTATADHGTFTNLNSNNGWQYSQGRTVFFDSTTAGQALFVNVGGDGGFLETGGTTEFRGNASAANGTFINHGPTGGSFPQPGKTQFFDTATAATATFTNKPGVGGGGVVEFYGHSTAATGNFINDGSSAVSANPGEVTFKEDAVAGQGNFHTTGQYGGYITFHDRTSADHGTFLIDPNLYNSRIVFDGSSTAGNASFEIGGGAYLQFFESSTAGNATILLRGNGAASSLGGFQGGTGGNAVITVMGAETNGAVGANLGFQSPATAGNAAITINGTSVTTFGALGGLARFDYGASAGTATFIVNGGSNGGAGGRLEFARGATAAQARFVLNAGSTLDVGGNVYYGGTPVGSIEGAGHISLGSSLLTVGFLNTSTTFSGVLFDDSNPNVGFLADGQLTKEGTGGLTLAGSNTYSGVTTINAGTLVVNGSLAGGVQVNTGAALKGSGSIGGSVTVAPGGLVAPGNSPGTLTIWSNYSQGPQGALEIEVAGPNPENRDLLVVNGNVNLGGILVLVFSGYAPSANESFPVLQTAGNYIENNLKLVVLGLKPGFQPSHQFSNGKLIITATSSGQLRTASDPIQALAPWFTPQSGFVYSVFTLAGLTYEFDTSTDLKNWTPVSQYPGANALVEFRHNPSAADSYRFYRLIEKSGTP